MEKTFLDYGEAVCRFLQHATWKEKAAIQAELSAHMTDHAQALLDAGYDTDHANRIALEAMGDPEEVGKALNKEYPLRWAVLAQIFSILLALLVLYLALFSIWWNTTSIGRTLEARTDPVSGHTYIPTHAGEIYPLDLRRELPGGTILDFYGVARDDHGYVWVYTVTYPKNPLSRSMNSGPSLTFTYGDTDTSDAPWQDLDTGGIGPRSSYYRYCLHEVEPGDTLTAHYDHFGTRFSIDIPWEEASP